MSVRTVRPPQRDVKWIDGLRGIASVLIVSGHTMLSFDPQLVFPCKGENQPARLWQHPFLRLLCGQGTAWVAIFFILSGYVNALKPIRLTEEGDAEKSLLGLSLSAFRRSARLILPASFVTVLVWFLTQIHFFEFARNSDAYWFRDNTPEPSRSVVDAIYMLGRNLITTWTTSVNDYDKPQWTLTYLLKGSFFTFILLFATAHCTRRWRLFLFSVMYFYAWLGGDPLMGFNTYFGIICASLSFRPTFQDFNPRLPFIKHIVPAAFVIFGLYLASYPGDENHPEWAHWSLDLYLLGQKIFPRGGELFRYWPGLGMHLVTIGIMLSSTLKHILAHPRLVWLGNVSFALYLVHGPMLRGVLAWILFAFSTATPREGAHDDGSKFTYYRYPLPSSWVFAIILPPFFALVLYVSYLFTQYVDPACNKVAAWFEDLCFGRDQDEKLLA